jgi:hypothetical protein
LAIGGIAMLVISASAVSLLVTQRRSNGRIDLAVFAVVGEVVARETAKLLGDQGRLVLVIPNISKTSQSPVASQCRSFERELRKIGSMEIVAREVISFPTAMVGAGIPADEYRKLVEKYPHVDAFVSFVGAPPGDTPRRNRGPRFVAVCSMPVGLEAAIKDGVVQLAVAPRLGGAIAPEKEPRSALQWFEMHYQIITAETAKSRTN